MSVILDNNLVRISQKLSFPHRIQIMRLLKSKQSASFREIKDCTNVSNGILWSHIRPLESDGLIQIRKQVNGRRVKTNYVITEKGIKAFEEFRDNMIKILN